MNDASKKESIWLALSSPAFRRYWLAALISGTCAAAHNTAVFSVLGESERSAFVISLMSTLSALPFAVFTLPAGALADMVDRKKILYATNLWQAIVGLGLMSLGLANLLTPYFILVSAFLFSVGFAFGSPAAASVQIQMVPKQQLPSAFVLGGLQMNISGIFGPLIGGLLVPLIGSSLIFGANGLGYLFLLLAVLLWKRAPTQPTGSAEDFFATIATTIRYVRYTPGIKVILTRIALFSFFISIIPALMPVVGLKELHLDPSQLGYLFTAMAVGSVAGAVFLVPLARARLSPNKLIICADLLLIIALFLMALVHRPHVFLVVAALGGAGWTLSASELWIAGQRAMPEWARGRMNAAIIMVSQAATALGGVVWGGSAAASGVIPTFLGAGVLAILMILATQIFIGKRLSVDFTANLNLEPAAVTIFSTDWDPARLSHARENPVSVITEFLFDEADRDRCIDLFNQIRLIYLRNGARDWHLYAEYVRSNNYQMEVVAPSWTDYQRQQERLTNDEKAILDDLYSLHKEGRPREFIRISVDRIIIKKIKSQGVTGGNSDQ